MTDEGPIGRYRLHRNDNMLGERGKNLRAEGYDVESPENWHLIWSFEHLEHAALKIDEQSLRIGRVTRDDVDDAANRPVTILNTRATLQNFDSFD